MHEETFNNTCDEPPQPDCSIPKHKLRLLLAVFIPAVSVIGVFFLCSVVFLVLKNIPQTAPYAYFSYFAALPVCCIVLTVFSFLWWNGLLQAVSISGLI